MMVTTKTAKMLVAGLVWVATMVLTPPVAYAQLPPFGPIDNGSAEVPPTEPEGGLVLNNFGSDVKLDFRNPGPVYLTAELAGNPTSGYILTVDLFGTATAQLYNPIPGVNPTAEVDLFFSTTEDFTFDEVTGNAGANPFSYDVDGVTIDLADDAPIGTSSGTVTLNGPLGPSLPTGSVFDLYEFGLGVLFLGWNDDAFDCGVSCSPFDTNNAGLVQGLTVSLADLLPTAPPRNPTDASLEYPLCWAPQGQPNDPRETNCLVNGVQQVGSIAAAGIVPEPETLALLALGLGGLAMRRRRARR